MPQMGVETPPGFWEDYRRATSLGSDLARTLGSGLLYLGEENTKDRRYKETMRENQRQFDARMALDRDELALRRDVEKRKAAENDTSLPFAVDLDTGEWVPLGPDGKPADEGPVRKRTYSPMVAGPRPAAAAPQPFPDFNEWYAKNLTAATALSRPAPRMMRPVRPGVNEEVPGPGSGGLAQVAAQQFRGLTHDQLQALYAEAKADHVRTQAQAQRMMPDVSSDVLPAGMETSVPQWVTETTEQPRKRRLFTGSKAIDLKRATDAVLGMRRAEQGDERVGQGWVRADQGERRLDLAQTTEANRSAYRGDRLKQSSDQFGERMGAQRRHEVEQLLMDAQQEVARAVTAMNNWRRNPTVMWMAQQGDPSGEIKQGEANFQAAISAQKARLRALHEMYGSEYPELFSNKPDTLDAALEMPTGSSGSGMDERKIRSVLVGG